VRTFIAVIAIALAVAAAGCGSRSGAPAGTGTGATTNPHMAVPPLTLTIYVTSSGTLAPKVVHVPQTRAVAAAALRALGVDAPVTIASGTATVALDNAPDDQVAEIVYTLTQFPTVQRVNVAGRTGLTRDDFAHYVPPILVDAPAAGSTVARTFTVSGTASVFEATVVVQLVRDGEVLSKQTVTASEGAPARGTYSTSVHATPGALTVEVFAPSAEDGSQQHEVDVPVTVAP